MKAIYIFCSTEVMEIVTMIKRDVQQKAVINIQVE